MTWASIRRKLWALIRRKRTVTFRRLSKMMTRDERRDRTRDRVWSQVRALVSEIPDCRVSIFMAGNDLCVQIRIGQRFERLSIAAYDLARTEEEFVGCQILMHLRHSKIVKEYREKRDHQPELP